MSAASSHREHPGTENVNVLKVLLFEDRSNHDVTPLVVADTAIVEVARASNHTDKFDSLDGKNSSLFTTGCIRYYTPFMTFWMETTDTPECLEKSLRKDRHSGFVMP